MCSDPLKTRWFTLHPNIDNALENNKIRQANLQYVLHWNLVELVCVTDWRTLVLQPWEQQETQFDLQNS